jgi:hypothetical protein
LKERISEESYNLLLEEGLDEKLSEYLPLKDVLALLVITIQRKTIIPAHKSAIKECVFLVSKEESLKEIDLTIKDLVSDSAVTYLLQPAAMVYILRQLKETKCSEKPDKTDYAQRIHKLVKGDRKPLIALPSICIPNTLFELIQLGYTVSKL